MGALLAKFRKAKTTEQILEGLDTKIQELENYTINTQQQKKRFVGSFVAFSLGIYIVAFLIFYFIYLPETWKERFIYFTPLLIFPVLIVLLRRLFTWYFQRKLNKNSDKLTALRAEKKKILEKVMDKETYKVAVNLLARFGDKSSGRLSFGSSPASRSSLSQNSLTLSGSQAPTSSGGSNNNNYNLSATPGVRSLRDSTHPLTVAAAVGTTPSLNQALSPQVRSNQMLRRRTPFPIVNEQQKSVFERCVDLLIGDGPQDRLAMICKECHAHNGMALKEEFFYTAFRCAFCSALNPARKTRPTAPKLSLPSQTNSPRHTPGAKRRTRSSSSDSSSRSSSENESGTRTRRPLQIRLTETTAASDRDINSSVSQEHSKASAAVEAGLQASADVYETGQAESLDEETQASFDAALLSEQLNEVNAAANAAFRESIKLAATHSSPAKESVGPQKQQLEEDKDLSSL